MNTNLILQIFPINFLHSSLSEMVHYHSLCRCILQRLIFTHSNIIRILSTSHFCSREHNFGLLKLSINSWNELNTFGPLLPRLAMYVILILLLKDRRLFCKWGLIKGYFFALANWSANRHLKSWITSMTSASVIKVFFLPSHIESLLDITTTPPHFP